jgi:hypothetical protein
MAELLFGRVAGALPSGELCSGSKPAINSHVRVRVHPGGDIMPAIVAESVTIPLEQGEEIEADLTECA